MQKIWGCGCFVLMITVAFTAIGYETLNKPESVPTIKPTLAPDVQAKVDSQVVYSFMADIFDREEPAKQEFEKFAEKYKAYTDNKLSGAGMYEAAREQTVPDSRQCF